MQKKFLLKKCSIPFLVCMFFSLHSTAQVNDLHTACAATGEGIAGSFRISYTIGEMVLVDTKNSSNLLVTQGILQPEAGIVNSTGHGFEPGEIQIFPVPTPDLLSIRIALFKKGNIALAFYDAAGRQLINETFYYAGFITKKYSLAKYPAGSYFLQIRYSNGADDEKKSGTYTIVKTN